MHLRSDFELLQQQTSVVRPPVHPASGRSPYAHQVVMRSPGRPQIASPVQFRHPGSPFQPVPIRMIPSPLHVVSPHPIHFAGSPQRAFGPLAVSPVRFVSSPHQAVGSGRKRGRSPRNHPGRHQGPRAAAIWTIRLMNRGIRRIPRNVSESKSPHITLTELNCLNLHLLQNIQE